jgi:DMSO reductase family type II enzyme chaperone
MPTRSEVTSHRPVRNEDWAARPAKPPCSVFANYSQRLTAGAGPAGTEGEGKKEVPQSQTKEPLQTAIDQAMARSFLYRFLAQAYQEPTQDDWKQLIDRNCRTNLEAAVRALSAKTSAFKESARLFYSQFQPEIFEAFLDAYHAAFGHAARGSCPLNEIEYGDIKADPLFQPHRLADITAFYRAFGLELSEAADERPDHICLEMEFMCVLAAKEAYALEHQLDAEAMSVCRAAQKGFLREHLGRWTPAFTRRLARMAIGTPLGALADLTRTFIESECANHGIPAGSEDLLLRPVDEASESVCNSCGVTQRLPGALPSNWSPV